VNRTGLATDGSACSLCAGSLKLMVEINRSSASDGIDQSETEARGRFSDRVSRSNLSSQIADRLRDDIVHGRLAPRTRLVQDELCERFGTSRIPVRDALQQLTHEGLLEQQGQQRVVVSLGIDDLEEAYALIAVLHAWAAGRAAVQASDEELAELDDLCERVVQTSDPYEFGQLAMQFHRKINLLSHSPRLIRTLSGFQQTVPRAMPFNIPDEMAPSKARYVEIVGALKVRDAELAERLTRSHSMNSLGLLLRSIEGSRSDRGRAGLVPIVASN
jgi:DNA-binding GntR family transcriptional regulator